MRRGATARPTLAAAACLLAACTLFDGGRRQDEELLPAARPAAIHIGQVGFARDARFVSCPASACPVVTPKHLISAAPSLAGETVLVGRSQIAQVTDVAHTTLSSGVQPPPGGSVKATRLEPSRKVTLRFRSGSARLTEDHKASLQQSMAGFRSSEHIVIAGRTDDVGSEALNQALALARGLAVRDHLLDLEPALPARIAIDARGRCCYSTRNDSSDGRAQNRRVEVIYGLSEGGAQ